MKQALEVLEQINQLSVGENAIALPGEIDAAMDNLRAAIEQPLKIDPADCHIRVGEVSEPISVGGKEPYDQTALELCKECGWKAVIPDDGCLVCARQKPVAWRWKEVKGEFVGDWVLTEIEPPPYVTESMPLYTAPRQWVELTDEEVMKTWNRVSKESVVHIKNFAHAIEAKLKEKNT
jgi:hypothetical protein